LWRLPVLRVNEIFYSIQGEGLRTGQASVFVRLSGCNLNCGFCDTDHTAYTEMSEDQILDVVREIGGRCRWVVLTGGEPLLQPVETLIRVLHEAGYKVQLESNGTVSFIGKTQTSYYNAPTGVEAAFPDHLTLSPKEAEPQQALVALAAEIKVVVRDEEDIRRVLDGDWPDVPTFLQPVSNDPEATKLCVQTILRHPHLRLSVQTHKLIGLR
jgi:7-carboxy-7-deazaguanine synthase